jgi:hypothetical protein
MSLGDASRRSTARSFELRDVSGAEAPVRPSNVVSALAVRRSSISTPDSPRHHPWRGSLTRVRELGGGRVPRLGASRSRSGTMSPRSASTRAVRRRSSWVARTTWSGDAPEGSTRCHSNAIPRPRRAPTSPAARPPAPAVRSRSTSALVWGGRVGATTCGDRAASATNGAPRADWCGYRPRRRKRRSVGASSAGWSFSPARPCGKASAVTRFPSATVRTDAPRRDPGHQRGDTSRQELPMVVLVALVVVVGRKRGTARSNVIGP